ncbi:hypothetical protein ONZ45_g2595 [Pleurotus djamor]|nr:hypothetical protein ONZ45_g2595 [Pleurotus djamor]
MNIQVANIASRLAPGQAVDIGDILVPLPSGLLRVAANIRTGIVYSTNMNPPFLLGQQFVVGEGGINVLVFNMASVLQDGTESRPHTTTHSRLSSISLAAMQDYVQSNALMLFTALGFPQGFYVVGEFQRQANVFPRVGGIVVRMQVPDNENAPAGTAYLASRKSHYLPSFWTFL